MDSPLPAEKELKPAYSPTKLVVKSEIRFVGVLEPPSIKPATMIGLGIRLPVRKNFLNTRIFNQMSRRRVHQSKSVFQEQARLAERRKLDEMQRLREARTKYRNTTATYYTASLGVLFLALAFGAVPLYRAICQRTGFGGVPITDSTKFTPDKLIPVDTNKRIKVQFTCQSSGILPWKFTPLQREVYIVPGETALAFYKAKNMSKEDIIGMATYSVTPDHVAPYFNKIQCFCFEEQRLSAGEEVEMPVFFFIDPEFAKDPAMRNIDDIVLHYSFFRASYSDGELAAIETERTKERNRIEALEEPKPKQESTITLEEPKPKQESAIKQELS